MYDLYHRNPHNYIKELLEVDETDMVWDRGLLAKRRINPVLFAQQWLGTGRSYKFLTVGNGTCAQYSGGTRPDAVYPAWRWGEPSAQIIDCIENPWGENRKYTEDKNIPVFHRPVFGQRHMVVISELPPQSHLVGKNARAWLIQLAKKYPEVDLYLHGSYSFPAMFCGAFKAGDYDGRTDASMGNVRTEKGKFLTGEKQLEYHELLRPMGYTLTELRVPRNRCMFNIKAVRWASTHWNMDFKTQVIRIAGQKVDTTSSDADWTQPAAGSILRAAKTGNDNDCVLCDYCSLFSKCSYYREGAVCTVPGSDDTRRLAEMFTTRNSDDIIKGLGAILATQSDRVQKAIDKEDRLLEADPALGLDPKINTMLNSIFKNGVSLAKLVDPSLNPGVRVQVNVGAEEAAKQINAANPKQFVTAAIAQLEAKGIPFEDITEQMIEDLMKNQLAIEGTVTEPVL
jgi:hypothetical protein